MAEFKAAIDDLQRRPKGSPKAEGQSRIYIHGEKEYENTTRNLKEGLAVIRKVVADLKALAGELNVEFFSTSEPRL